MKILKNVTDILTTADFHNKHCQTFQQKAV